ncbi:alpha/beta hydrolase [Planctomicrobium sp. SH664]|uniref:alpha/beta hydrolase n=1 Tax=Planctomicrobium sp. SH664 TaxID=3448125 RepID=UPI003F5C4417
MSHPVQLETAARKFADETAKPPFLFQIPPAEGRAAVDKVQSEPVAKPDVEIIDKVLPVGPSGKVAVKVLKPRQAGAGLPVIVYIHGAGWVFGNAHTHDRLIRELCVGVNAVLVFPEYSLSPEAKYPTAVEECSAVIRWVSESAQELGGDPRRLAVAGDSVGGNMTAACTLLAKQRGGPAITQQLLFYPVTNASFDTDSYHQFAEGYFLRRDGMQWFWDQYLARPEDRLQITASPLLASLEQLQGLPRALVITGEADVLRDEGEAYANKLRAAGVEVTAVRFQGIIHDFVMLNALSETNAARGAMLLAIHWLREGFAE